MLKPLVDWPPHYPRKYCKDHYKLWTPYDRMESPPSEYTTVFEEDSEGTLGFAIQRWAWVQNHPHGPIVKTNERE